MKTVFFAFLILVSSSSAFAWEKAIDCDNGGAVIDFTEQGFMGRIFQLVIRDRAAVNQIMQNSAVDDHRRNQRGEIIVPLASNGGSFREPEFIGREDAYRVNGRVIFVKAKGESLTLESFRTTQPTGGMYEQKEKIAELTFRGCR